MKVRLTFNEFKDRKLLLHEFSDITKAVNDGNIFRVFARKLSYHWTYFSPEKEKMVYMKSDNDPITALDVFEFNKNYISNVNIIVLD